MADLHATGARIAAESARMQAREGSEQLRTSRSRFGKLGFLGRAAVLRAMRPLAVRESLVDEQVITALDALALDTSLSHRGATSFPEPLPAGMAVDIETELGPLFMHADDAVMTPLIRERGSWEPSEAAFLRSALSPGDTFLDVGANFGYFSVFGSILVGPSGRVVAIEPEGRNLLLLKANLWRHGCGNAVVLPIAAYRDSGFLPLHLNEENRGDHQVGWKDGASALVPCARLDDLLADLNVTVAKVDTQGVEHDVIAGMSGLLDANPSLTILCEFWVEGMEQRGIDPHAVAEEYLREGFELGLLQGDGSVSPATPAEVVATAAADEWQYANIVLRRGRER
jgi:FkbM family methyltransferase